MRYVLLIIAASAVVSIVMLWRYYQVRSLGQDICYQAPMRVYSAAGKKMVRGKFDQALQEYLRAREMIAAIPGIDLKADFYYAIVNNAIGTIYLRRGIYGEKR
jgi:subtilase family serine protease